jgi:hypothetical protein
MFGAIDGARGAVEAVIETNAIDVIEAPMAGSPHVPLLAANRGFAAFQAGALAGIEPAALDALPDALQLECASLVDGSGVALHGRRCGCYLRKANGGSKCEKSDAKQRDFHGVSP